MKLSPLTRDRIVNRGFVEPNVTTVTPEFSSRYRRWECPVCSDLHKTESGADDCCPRRSPEEVFVDPSTDERFGSASELAEFLSGNDELTTACPVCHVIAKDVHDAANCCLWKDLDAQQRYELATAVERGATWQEVLLPAEATS